MVSQHPDHAATPYWQASRHITTSAEVEECFRSFSDLNADEYMWDWEGKFVDEAVIERLFHTYSDYFATNPLGKTTFLTFRVPHSHSRTDHRLGRALLTIKTAASLSQAIGFHSPPLVEVIIPLVETAAEMMELHEAYDQLKALNHKVFKLGDTHHRLGVIPIFEQTDTLFNAKSILLEYITRYQSRYKTQPPYLRPFSARSDPALNSGLIPAILANKVALKQYQAVSDATGVPTYPIIGPGALPFRGHLTPDRVPEFLAEYPSIHTALVQGAFRYDWDQDVVKSAISALKQHRPKQPQPVDEASCRTISDIFTQYYRATIEKIAPQINYLARFLPPRRERVLHIGLFGYSRQTGNAKLPRAIGFTAALYSLGAPPEIIGTGRGLKAIQQQGLLPTLEKYYSSLCADLQTAFSYYSPKAVQILAKTNPAWNDVIQDATIIAEFLRSRGQCTIHIPHQRLSDRLVKSYHQLPQKQLTKLIERGALMRRSIG